RPGPHRDGPRAWLRGEPASGPRRRRRPHVVDDPVALPGSGDVPLLREAAERRFGRRTAAPDRHGARMTKLSLRNPIAILMAAIAVLVFAAVVAPRMSVDTFPELTPPVLVVGTMAPGLGPKDVEKTLTWRIEKYVSATPGVDHVQSVSRNSLS